jgi:hypothetical protein
MDSYHMYKSSNHKILMQKRVSWILIPIFLNRFLDMTFNNKLESITFKNICGKNFVIREGKSKRKTLRRWIWLMYFLH